MSKEKENTQENSADLESTEHTESIENIENNEHTESIEHKEHTEHTENNEYLDDILPKSEEVDSFQEVLEESESTTTEEFNDKEIDRSEDRGLIEQNQSVVVWRIENLHDTDGKIFSPRALKANPPTLIVSDGEDNEVTFLLTKNLAMHLNGAFSQVYHAYYGISTKSSDNPGSFAWNLKRSSPFIVIIVLLIVAFVLSNFF